MNNIFFNLLYCKLVYDWYCVLLWVMISCDLRVFVVGFNSCVELVKVLLLVKLSVVGVEVDM